MKKNGRVGCVIVNYNDAKTTERLLRLIYAYSVLDAVIIVDNGSTDDSLGRLKRAAGELNQELGRNKLVVLSAEKNGGYGAGNNVGLRYAHQVLEADYVLIANPDVEFSEILVRRLLMLFSGRPMLGVVSASMQDPVYGKQRNGWPLYGFWRELARCGPVCRRVFRNMLEYREKYFQGKKAVYVDAVHGSLLMVDVLKMLECGAYDEELFLYQEEAVLGCRMRKLGYRTALLLTDSYLHRHSASISQTYKDTWERQKLRNQSCLKYYRNYLSINRMQEFVARVFFQVIHLEIWCFERFWRQAAGRK